MGSKILFVSHESSVNGATRSLVSLIQGIKEISNIEVEVVIPYSIGSTARELLKQSGIKYKEFFYRRDYKNVLKKYTLKEHIYDVLNSLAARRINYYMRKKKIDMVCSNSVGTDVGARAARMAKLPHIYYVREFMEEDYGFEFRNKDRMKYLLEASDCVIFISKSIQEKYTNQYCLKEYTTFFNGFIIENYFIPDHRIMQKEIVKIIQVGTLCDGKGTGKSLETIKELKDKGIENFCVEFIGNGTAEYIATLQKYIHENNLGSLVQLSGYCKQIKDKMMASDILLMNSRAEGFGRVTVEGMLGGLLVIGRNSAGTAEIIQDGRTGLLFNTDEELDQLLQKVLNDPKRYCGIACQGQTWAVNTFECKNVAKKFMDFVGIQENGTNEKGNTDNQN